MGSSSTPRGRTSPTIFDVARLAGVSHQTVSRVINNHASVRESTRERVRQAVEQLSYRPNAAARAMVGRPDAQPRADHHRVVRLRTDQHRPRPALGRPGRGLLGLAGHRHRHRARVGAGRGRPRPRPARRGPRRRRLAGPHPRRPGRAEPAAAGRGRGVERADRPPLALDRPVRRRPARHGAPHRASGTATSPTWPARPDAMDATERLRGLARHHGRARAGRPPPARGRLDARLRLPHRHAADAARRPASPALVVANDQMSLGCIHALAEQGIRVPEDVSVVGFDDIPEAEHFAPPLTTMRQDFRRLGTDILTTVLDVRRGPAGRARRCGSRPTLVVRRSTRRAGLTRVGLRSRRRASAASSSSPRWASVVRSRPCSWPRARSAASIRCHSGMPERVQAPRGEQRVERPGTSRGHEHTRGRRPRAATRRSRPRRSGSSRSPRSGRA